VKKLDDAIARAENGNLKLRKFIRFRPHEDNPKIGLSDIDLELSDKLKIPDFMDKEKLKSPTPHPSRSSNNYKIPTVEIPPVDIDQSQYQDFSESIQPGPTTISNRPNMCSHTKNYNKFNFRSLSPVKSSASETANSDKDSEMSDHFHPSSGKIVQQFRQWWKIYASNDIQIDGFKRLSEVDPSIPELKSDDEIILFSRFNESGFVINIVEEEELKGYWKAVNGPNGQLWKQAVDKELVSLDRAGT
jgi:hypothetical protein